MSSIAAAMGQLPRFDGRSPDPKVWISQATRALRCFLASIPEEQQLDYLLMHLTDSAYVWAESKDFQSVAGFDKAFKERFIWESAANVMQRLTALKQKPGQTLTELADEVRQLAAYVPNYPTAMAVRHFIEGLGDKGLRERVLGGRPISLEAAEEAAKYFVSYSLPMGIEPVVEAAKEKDPVNKESEVDKITKQLEKLSIQLAQMQQGRGGGLLPRPAGGGFKCYQCGEGHMARDCTQKGRAALNVMQQVLEGKAPTIAEFLNREEGKLDMLVGPRKRQAVRDPEGWGIDEAREELRKKLAETGGAEEAAKGSRFVRRPRVSALPNSYNVVDQLKLTPVSASVWNYISDSDKVRKELLDALKLAEDKGKEDGAAVMQGVSIVAAAPRESRHEDPIPSNLVFQVPQCDVHLGKHRLTAIVDSGASQTALSHVIARKLGLLPYLQDTTIEYTTSSGETLKPWGILPDVPVRVGKLTLPIDIAVTGANTYDMLLGQDWIYSANVDILTSKGQIVYRVNTKETDSVPITTGPVGTGSRPSYVSLPPQTPRRNDPTPPQHWSGMNEEEFQRWLEEKQLLLAKEQGRIRLTEEEEADYWAWVQEEEELDRAELDALELKEHGFYEELGTGGLDGIPEGGEPEGEVGTDDEMPSLFGSDGKRYSDLGASDDEAGEPHWDMGYEEARKAVEEKGEIADLWEGDSMTDGEEYLVEDKEEGELAYEGKGHRISPNYLFELFNYPAAERWQYLAAEKGDEGRIVLGSYYSLKKEAPRVACPAFEDLPVSLNHELGTAQQTDLRKLLVGYREVFATEAEPLGTHPTVFHHIATGSAKPISHKPYRVSPSERARIEEEVAALLEQGVIRPSNSPWASPCIVIPKKDFGDRVVIDYRPLNAVTEAADQFPMPRIDDILDRMTGSLYFSVLDVKSAYHTIRVAEEDIPKTAFVTSSGQYDWEEHLEHLRDVFERVKANHLLLKPNKCELGFYSTIYLGHIVTRDGVKPDAGKVEAISMMAAPVDVRGVREFLGCTSYYRRFIKGYAKVAHSLTQLLHKDNPFEWTDKSGEESSSSVDGEGDGGDSGEEEGDEVAGREPEELSSNTEKRDGEEEGEVGQAGSEESDDGDEGSGEEDDETDGSGGEDDEDGEEEEEEAAEGDQEMVAPGVGGQENDHEGSEERGSSPPMTQPLKKVRRDKGKSKEEAGTSKGDEKEAGGGGPPHGTQGEEQPGKSLASETTTLDIWDDLNTLFYLECGEVDPVWDKAEKRRVRARGKKFELRDGVLWNLKAKGDKKPVPRKEEREEIISLLHGLGHLGVQRTTDLVRKQYDWYGMGSDVSAFVRGCPTCTFQRGSWTAKGELRPVPVTKPWDRVVIDFVGPLPVTEKGGNRYIISTMDHFTKWPECKAVRHADSATAAAFVAEKIISTHGCPLFSPFFLLNGRHPNITGSTLTEWEVKELTELSTEEEADAAAGLIYERSSEMELALAKAAENHDKAQEKQKVDFDRRRTLLEPIRGNSAEQRRGSNRRQRAATGGDGQQRHGQQRAATGSTGTGSNGWQQAAQARAATGGNRQHRHGQQRAATGSTGTGSNGRQRAAQARAATGGNGQHRHGQQRAATGSTGTGSNRQQQAAQAQAATGGNRQHRHGQQRAATGSTGTGSNGRQRAAQARAATGGNGQRKHGQQRAATGSTGTGSNRRQRAAQARAVTGSNGQHRHRQQRAATGSTGTGSNRQHREAAVPSPGAAAHAAAGSALWAAAGAARGVPGAALRAAAGLEPRVQGRLLRSRDGFTKGSCSRGQGRVLWVQGRLQQGPRAAAEVLGRLHRGRLLQGPRAAALGPRAAAPGAAAAGPGSRGSCSRGGAGEQRLR
ncbi:unnamed protein product [Closterium sp. NIES-64]|nr:unnamed protein product [Closterium sp. NIES-64]